MLKITIPKRLYENKTNVTPIEFLDMFTEFVARARDIEEELKYKEISDMKYINENYQLKQHIKELEAQLEKGGVAI